MQPSIQVISHPEKGMLFKATYQEKGSNIVKTSTVSAENFYNILSTALGKENLLYDTGILPAEVVRVSETSSSFILQYLYPKINFDYKIFAPCFRGFYNKYKNTDRFKHSNLVIIEPENSDINYFSIPNIYLENIHLSVTVYKEERNPEYVLSLYSKPDPFIKDNHLYPYCISHLFANHFSSAICWGGLSSLENLYNDRSLGKKSISEIANTYLGLPYNYFNSVFNTDLLGNSQLRSFMELIQDSSKPYKEAFETFYNYPGLVSDVFNSDTYAPCFLAPLFLNYIYRDKTYYQEFFTTFFQNNNNRRS